MKYSLIIVILISIFACTNEKKEFQSSTLSLKIDSILVNHQFNGVLLITKENQTIYQKAIGFRDLEHKISLKIDDQFYIGSISKQITAILILQEVEKGRISLDAKISDYLKQINQPWAKEITIQDYPFK